MRYLVIFPPKILRLIKLAGVNARFFIQSWRGRINFRKYEGRYQHKTLFIAGLPKSGTTWLKGMLAGYPGFDEILIPDATSYELKTGGSHDYDLPLDIFSRFKNMLVITKMHVPGSTWNVKLLDEAGINYVVLYRDLRDVAVSYCYYVRKTAWHPEYPVYSKLSLEEGLKRFADTLLGEYAEWVGSWGMNLNPERGLMVKYEMLVKEPYSVMSQIAEHFELDNSSETIKCIVDDNSFIKLSRGRNQGESNPDSFFRKGIAGDWKNHFTPEINKLYKEKIGQFLIKFEYEQNLDW